jgi:hypothetical protein
MKIKNLLLPLLVLAIAGTSVNAQVGSLIKKNDPLKTENNEGAGYWATKNATVNWQVVTVSGWDSKGDAATLLFSKSVGTGYTLAGQGWSSQIQLYTGATKTNEISVASGEAAFITVTQAANTMVINGYPLAATEAGVNGVRCLQEENNNFGWTDIAPYSQTAPNSGLTESEKPVLSDAVLGNPTGTTYPVTITATDNSGDMFYVLRDDANKFAWVLLEKTGVITVKAGVNYSIKVTAYDYAGNASDPKTLTIGETAFESVSHAVLDDFEFTLSSPNNNALTVTAKANRAENPLVALAAQIGTPETTFSQVIGFAGSIPEPMHVITTGTYGDMGNFSIPGVATCSNTFNGLAGNAEGIIRVAFIYLLDPIPAPVDQAGWQYMYEQQKVVSKTTDGRFIDF